MSIPTPQEVTVTKFETKASGEAYIAAFVEACRHCLSYGAWMLEDYTTSPALAWLDHWREQIPAEAANELRRVVAAPAEPITVEPR